MGIDLPSYDGRHLETESQIAEVLALVDEVLGSDVVGAYLHGSSALGGLRTYSDLDILVVSRRPTTQADRCSCSDSPRPDRRRRGSDAPLVFAEQPVEVAFGVQVPHVGIEAQRANGA
ncbi:MAG TPA: nucleotidyltransferase domain-containing protein, partial [Chloroflexota bacterium]|nr:nucleotidyltransferase domain-containing protein [Chloroflexota bacterium]